MPYENYLSETKDGTILKVVAKPNSKRQQITIDSEEKFVVISLKSPPAKGKANKELVKFLAKLLDLSSSQLMIISGQTSRDKSLLISGKTLSEIREKIELLANDEE